MIIFKLWNDINLHILFHLWKPHIMKTICVTTSAAQLLNCKMMNGQAVSTMWRAPALKLVQMWFFNNKISAGESFSISFHSWWYLFEARKTFVEKLSAAVGGPEIPLGNRNCCSEILTTFISNVNIFDIPCQHLLSPMSKSFISYVKISEINTIYLKYLALWR